MSFEMLCMTMIGLLFGAALIFGGYRLFLILLPIWGFFFGIALGAQTVQIIFGGGFLATVTSWVVGFIVGIVFAVLAYLFYIVAVALLAGSFGYALGVGLVTMIIPFGFIAWTVGIIAGIALAVVVIMFNIQKYAIIAITAFGGTAAVILVLLAAFGGTPALTLMAEAPVKYAITNSFWWMLFFLVVGIAGVVVQLRVNSTYTIEEYDRYSVGA